MAYFRYTLVALQVRQKAVPKEHFRAKMPHYVHPPASMAPRGITAMHVTLFASRAGVDALEATLAPLTGNARVPALLALAWHRRQSHCVEALRLADEAQKLLAGFADGDALKSVGLARLALVRAEVDYLFARLDAAEVRVDEAALVFKALGDSAGMGDAQWLMAAVWSDRGNRDRCNASLEQGHRHYLQSQDVQRIDAIESRRIFLLAFEDPTQAGRELAQGFATSRSIDPGVHVWVQSAHSVIGNISSDYNSSIAHGHEAMAAASESGQLRQAIISALNLSHSFAALGDLDATLEAAENATALARPTGWPGMVSACLFQTANGLRHLKRFDEASSLLLEALSAADQLKGSRNNAVILGYLGDLSLDTGDAAQALAWFSQYEEAIAAFPEPSLMMVALRGQATALSRLNRPQEANAKVHRALQLAQEHANPEQQIIALRALAELHRCHPLPIPDTVAASDACLHFLEQALAVAEQINGYVAPADFLQEVSHAYAAAGNFERAYHHAQAAVGSVEKARHTDATKRAIAMQVRFATQHSTAEAEHHRKLAQTESEKAQVLQQTSATLEVLGRIGCEITACLNLNDVCEALYRHVNEMLDATSFDIYLLEPSGDSLCGAFSMENGAPYALDRIPFSDLDSYSVRCAQERRELPIDLPPTSDNPNLIPGTVMTHSLFFTPLLVGDRLLGVMSIQSAQVHAYGAIAIDNADAYAQAQRARAQADDALTHLRDTQARLVQSEKMAALGKLVAGVAHELNTPLGNCQMALTTLRSQLQTFRDAVATAGLRRSEFDAFLDNVNTGSELALSGVSRSASLVAKFKQLAVHQGQGDRRAFQLRDAVNQAVVGSSALMEHTPYPLEVDIPEDCPMDSYPQALAETLGNLLSNAVLHGLGGRTRGSIGITASRNGPINVQLRVTDDGVGISPDDLPHIFDPFFSTKFGQGGSGLGLHLAHNLVTQVLGGRLTVTSAPGQGSAFLVDIPSTVPITPSPSSA